MARADQSWLPKLVWGLFWQQADFFVTGRFVIWVDLKSTNPHFWIDSGSDCRGILLNVIVKGVVLYLFTLVVVKLLLLRSGDVELNLGPSGYKSCPSCHENTVPVKLRVCNYGHIFHKKSYRQPHASFGTVPKTTTISTSYVDVVNSTISDYDVDNDMVEGNVQTCVDEHEVSSEVEAAVQTQPVVISVVLTSGRSIKIL